MALEYDELCERLLRQAPAGGGDGRGAVPVAAAAAAAAAASGSSAAAVEVRGLVAEATSLRSTLAALLRAHRGEAGAGGSAPLLVPPRRPPPPNVQRSR